MFRSPNAKMIILYHGSHNEIRRDMLLFVCPAENTETRVRWHLNREQRGLSALCTCSRIVKMWVSCWMHAARHMTSLAFSACAYWPVMHPLEDISTLWWGWLSVTAAHNAILRVNYQQKPYDFNITSCSAVNIFLPLDFVPLGLILCKSSFITLSWLLTNMPIDFIAVFPFSLFPFSQTIECLPFFFLPVDSFSKVNVWRKNPASSFRSSPCFSLKWEVRASVNLIQSAGLKSYNGSRKEIK